MTRRDWWLGVLLIAVALLVHALVPRYKYLPFGEFSETFTRMDRWTGSAELVSVGVDADRREGGGRVGARFLNPINESFRESWRQVKEEELYGPSGKGLVLRSPSPTITGTELSTIAARRGVSLDEAAAEAEAEGFQVNR